MPVCPPASASNTLARLDVRDGVMIHNFDGTPEHYIETIYDLNAASLFSASVRHVARSALRALIEVARVAGHPTSVPDLPRQLVGAPRTNLSHAPAHYLARWASRPMTSETHRIIAMRGPVPCAGCRDLLTPKSGHNFFITLRMWPTILLKPKRTSQL